MKTLSNPRLTEFKFNDVVVYGLELNQVNVQGYIKWRQILFIEAYKNLQTLGHPNGYHHRVVFALTGIINILGFDATITDINTRLLKQVDNIKPDQQLFVFEDFTNKYKSDLDELGYTVTKQDIPVASAGFPLYLEVKENPTNDTSYILIENEKDNSDFNILADSNPTADYYRITNFITKDIVTCLGKLQEISEKYKHVKLWFQTIDMDGKYSDLFQKILKGDVLPDNVTIEPNEGNVKFTELLNQK